MLWDERKGAQDKEGAVKGLTVPRPHTVSLLSFGFGACVYVCVVVLLLLWSPPLLSPFGEWLCHGWFDTTFSRTTHQQHASSSVEAMSGTKPRDEGEAGEEEGGGREGGRGGGGRRNHIHPATTHIYIDRGHAVISSPLAMAWVAPSVLHITHQSP